MFQKAVFNKFIKELDQNLLKEKYEKFKENYQNQTKIEQIKNSKEEQYQEGFLRDIFVRILGYTINPEPNFNLITEKRNENTDKKDARKADGAIIINKEVKCVIELKGTDTTDLNKIENQALGYKAHHKGCRYIIISNFEKLRFYIDDATQHLEFHLFTLDFSGFCELYTLLAYEQIKADIPAKIKELSINDEESITKKFYKDYSDFKNAIFADICEQNPAYDKLELFRKTQKLLDRMLFVLFCEDKGLLPANSVENILNRFKATKENYIEKPLYDFFKQFFGWIDTGLKDDKMEIFAYNGGLFKSDEILDNIKISDEILLKHTHILANYDFDSDVSVDILGRIFEHSISEIESKENEIQGLEQENKRKKDGIFYTPAYITKYIVQSTLGALCNAKKDELDISENFVSSTKRNKDDKIAIIKQYREWLKSLKICDPACGSGAFLNATLRFLKAEHKLIDEIENALYRSKLDFSYYDNEILENNIYGVDINGESVEIAKLSLWLNTASKGRKLSTLSSNIKRGNSLLNSEFNWQKEFPEVFAKGGFDVIIGNPPYVKEYTNKSAFDGLKGSPYYKGKMDLWYAFVCYGIDLLRKNGILGFIAQNNWTTSEGASIMRNKIIDDAKILQMIDFNTYMIFENADTQTMIMLFEKNNCDDNYCVDYRKIIGNNCNIKDIADILKKRENLNIKYLSPIILREEFKDKSIIFSENNELLDKISKGKLFLSSNEATNGIHAHHDCVTKKIHENYLDLEIGKGIFVLSQKEKENLMLAKEENELLKPFYDSNEIFRFYINPQNKSWIIYTDSSFKNVNSMDKYPHLKSHLDLVGKAITSDNKPYGLHRARDEYFFKGEKIVSLRKCVGRPCFSYSDFDCYVPAMYYVIKTNRWNMKFLTSLLNSKLVTFWLKSKGKMQGENFQVDKAPLMEIPIPNVSEQKQKELANFADIMISLNEQFQKCINSFWTILKANYNLDKIPSALSEFYNLDFNDFLKLSKLKVPLGEQKELLEFFENSKNQCKNIKAQITNTENEINKAVYALYELNADEIKAIESV